MKPSPLFTPPLRPRSLIVTDTPGVTVIGKFAAVIDAAPAEPCDCDEPDDELDNLY